MDLISHLPDAAAPRRRAPGPAHAHAPGYGAMDEDPPAGRAPPGEERAAAADCCADGEGEELPGEYGVPVMGIPVYLGTPAVLLPGLFPR